MGISVRFRDLLPPGVAEELDQLTAGIRGVFFTEHNADGTHGEFAGNVVADGYGTFRNQPRTFVRIASNQSLPNNTETLISWSAPAPGVGLPLQPDSGWNLGDPPMWRSDDPTNFRVSVPGLYLCQWGVRFDGNATGIRYTFLTVGGAGTVAADLAQVRHAPSASGNALTGSIVLPLRTDNLVHLWAYQNSGGSLDLVSGFLNTWFQITKIG